MRERNQDFPNFWHALLIVGLLLGTEIYIATAFYDAGMELGPGDPRGSIVTVLGCGLIFSILLTYKKIGYRQLFSPSGLSFGSSVRPLILPVLLLSIGWVILAAEITNLLFYPFPISEEEQEAFLRLLSGGVASFIALCLVAPFVEEMLFRGLFLRGFLRNYAPRQAIVLSALIFGIMHLNVYQFVSAFVGGLLLGWLYYVTRSLWPSILVHFSYNFGCFVYAQLLTPEPGPGTPGSLFVHPIPFLLVAIGAFAFGLWRVILLAPSIPKNAA